MSATTGVFQLAVKQKRREFAHAHTIGGNFELKITRMRESYLTTMQLENPCSKIHLTGPLCLQYGL